MTSPNGNVRPSSSAGFERRLADMEQRIRAIEQRTAQRLGRTSVVDPDNNNAFYSGPSTNKQRPDGQPMWLTRMRRDGGELMFSSDAASSTEDSSFRQYWSLTDAQGNIIVSDDAYTGLGLALPWIPVVMYPKFTTSALKYGYMTIDNGQIHTETTVWEGRIPLVIQPYLTVDGAWGVGSGSSTAPVYKLKVQGTTVDTWTESGLGIYQRGPVDIRPWFGWHFTKIEITVVVPTGTGAQIAAQVLGCTMRQS